MERRMDIVITEGVGTADSRLAAFDAALHDAGIANLNLITLSSVIPPGSEVRCGRLQDGPLDASAGWGDRLYCVLAESRATKPGEQAWAGLAWWQAEDNRGIFVEEHGDNEEGVTNELKVSIRDCVERRGMSLDKGRWGLAVQGVTCEDRPVCALVAATYETQGWGFPGTINPS